MKILVIDDFPIFHLLIKRILSHQGYEIVTAYNGYEGLARFKEEQPDLVLLDILLPDINGCQVAMRIKQESADIFVPVIFLATDKDEIDLVECLDSGGDDYILKPFNETLLEAKLRVWERNISFIRSLQEREPDNSNGRGLPTLSKEEIDALLRGGES